MVENVKTVPFEVKRTYYLYTIYQVARRVVDTLIKNCFNLVIAASGSFNVTVDDGSVKRTFFIKSSLSRSIYCSGNVERTG